MSGRRAVDSVHKGWRTRINRDILKVLKENGGEMSAGGVFRALDPKYHSYVTPNGVGARLRTLVGQGKVSSRRDEVRGGTSNLYSYVGGLE